MARQKGKKQKKEWPLEWPEINVSNDYLRKLMAENADSPVFLRNKRNERVLAAWLVKMPVDQARGVAERILGEELNPDEFFAIFKHTFNLEKRRQQAPKKQVKRIYRTPRSKTPNTATFGGKYDGHRDMTNPYGGGSSSNKK